MKFKKIILMTAAAGVLTGAVSVSAAVCESDQYIVASDGENGSNIFDADGNFVASTKIDNSRYGMSIVSNTAVVIQESAEGLVPFSFETLENLPAIDKKSVVSVYGQYYAAAIVEEESSSFDVYDNTGVVRYHIDASFDDPTKCKVGFSEFASGFAAACYDGENSVGVLFDLEGNAVREITDENMCELIAAKPSNSVGDYLVDENRLIDLEGNEVFTADEIVVGVEARRDTNYLVENPYAVKYISVRDGEEWRALDGELNETRITAPIYVYAGDFVQNMIYEELGDTECMGFVLNKDHEYQPYYTEEDKAYVYTDGIISSLLEFPIENGSTIVEYNDDYYITRVEKDGKAVLRVHSIADDGILAEVEEFSKEEYGPVDSARITKDYVLVITYSEESQLYYQKIYDWNQEEVFVSEAEIPNLRYWNEELFLTKVAEEYEIIRENGEEILGASYEEEQS